MMHIGLASAFRSAIVILWQSCFGNFAGLDTGAHEIRTAAEVVNMQVKARAVKWLGYRC